MTDDAPPVSRELVARAPKVLLHDHLDGGLRPRTIVELAAESGHPLPAERRRRAAALVRGLGGLRHAWSATSRPSSTRSR